MHRAHFTFKSVPENCVDITFKKSAIFRDYKACNYLLFYELENSCIVELIVIFSLANVEYRIGF